MLKRWRPALIALALLAAFASGEFIQHDADSDLADDPGGEWIWDHDPNP